MDELQCEICCKIFNDSSRRPKNLHCGHTFCSECITKEITNGKSTCPTCRKPHNAKSVAELPMNVTVERLIRKLIETLSTGAKSYDSEDEDEDDDCSGGPCSTHKKSILYFYCETHEVQICKECTVIDHPTSKCKIISFKDMIIKTSSTITAANGALSALKEFVEDKYLIISNKEHTIQQCKNAIEEATKTIADERKAIATENIAIEKARNQIAKGIVQIKDMEGAKWNLQSAKKKKNTNVSKDIEVATKNITKWIHDVTTEYEIFLYDEDSPVPDNILKGLKYGKAIYAETTVNGKKAIAKLETKDDKLHLHPFKYESSLERAITVQYEKVVSHLPQHPPTLLFLDLTYKNDYKGRVYIRLEPDLHAFVKHIPAIITGENGNSVLGNKCLATIKHYHLPIFIERDVNDIYLRKVENVTVQTGAVLCYFNLTGIHEMFLHLGCVHTYKSDFAKIGHVVSGLEVAKACMALGECELRHITISDCGLVLEM